MAIAASGPCQGHHCDHCRTCQGGRCCVRDRLPAGVSGGTRSLREARVQRLLTIREVAALAGVAPSTIYLIEAGRTRPLYRVIRQIAAALEVDPDEIYEFRSQHQPATLAIRS